MNFTKTVRIGSIPSEWGKRPDHPLNIFAKIEFADGKLSISGVIDPRASGNAGGSCGQFIMDFKEYDHRGHASIKDIAPATGWTRATIKRFFDTWDRWHLNDLKAGSAAQEAWLRANPIPDEEYAYPKSHYEVASAKLAEAGLNPDADGYKYGSAWKTEEVPADVLDFLRTLPEADEQPAWV